MNKHPDDYLCPCCMMPRYEESVANCCPEGCAEEFGSAKEADTQRLAALVKSLKAIFPPEGETQQLPLI